MTTQSRPNVQTKAQWHDNKTVTTGHQMSVGVAATLLVIGALAMGSSPAFARWSGLDMFASLKVITFSFS
ncbi:MAG: hypothetical protein AAF141_09775, partial [Pseudomonadota bacterium]